MLMNVNENLNKGMVQLELVSECVEIIKIIR